MKPPNRTYCKRAHYIRLAAKRLIEHIFVSDHHHAEHQPARPTLETQFASNVRVEDSEAFAPNDFGQQAMTQHSPADESFMRRALQQANLALSTPGAGEVGCVIVKDGEIVAEAFNEGELRSDPPAHAEMVAIRKPAARWKTIDLRDATLYCTLQPCAMCTMACVWANIGKIVYGASRNDVNNIYFELRHFNTADLICDAFKDDMKVIGGVPSQECSAPYLKRNQPVPPEKAAQDVAH